MHAGFCWIRPSQIIELKLSPTERMGVSVVPEKEATAGFETRSESLAPRPAPPRMNTIRGFDAFARAKPLSTLTLATWTPALQ